MSVTAPSSSLHPYLVHADLRPLRENETLVIAPDGQMFEVAAPPETLGAVLSRCDGSHSLEEVTEGTDQPDGWREVLQQLIDASCLLDQPPLDTSTPERGLLGLRFSVLAEEPFDVDPTRLSPASSFPDSQLLDRKSLLNRIAQMDPELDVVLVFLRFFDRSFLVDLDERCREHRIRWASLHLDRGRAWLGPAIEPGRTADYTDLIDRRMCCSDSDEMFAAETALPLTHLAGEPSLPTASGIAWLTALFTAEVERWLRGAPCRLLSTELEADPENLTVEAWSFLPMPHRRLEGPFRTSAQPGPEMLVNHRSGAVIRSVPVEHHPSVPAGLVTVQAHVSNIARKYPCANDVIVGGSNFGDGRNAYYASIGEAVERYCGNYIPGETVRRASYNQLKAAGEYALDPDSMIFFEDSMYDEPGCPMVRFTRDLEVLWVQGRSLTKDRPAWLPISLTYVNWHTAYRGEPITNYYWFPGIAAGANLEHALVSGLEEIVERDITMIWWMNRLALPAMKTTPELDALWDKRSLELGQRPWLVHLDNEFNIPVMAGILENTKEGYFNIGFGCRPDPVVAAAKAWTEALTLQEGSRDMDDPNGLLRTSVEDWGLIDVPYKDWRKDKRYLDDYREDYRDVSDLLQQQQVNLDPRCLERVREWVDTPRTREFADIPSLPDRSLATIQTRIESRGYEIFYKDITTADVELTGLKAARVIVPGLAPNTSAAFPPLGKDRIMTAPVSLGLREQPLSKAELNYQPLPHA
ncbi:MAG: YcaO-like family protein [Acidobacteriota bacterium]|nr:YcaO-like family protein [Acidobacteriota bacterium]